MLMELVSRIIANQYIQNVAIKNAVAPKTLIKTIYGDNAPIFNRRTGEMNSISSREDRIIQQLAEAKAQSTGRLTSSQILDGEGNALASSSLSRLLSTLLYQVQQQVKQNGSAA
jgi:hypothetical protein